MTMVVALLCVSAQATPSAAQNFPMRYIRLVTTEAGSGNDLASRLIAPGLAAGLGQPVIVDNRGVLAAEIVARSPPDGHTLVLYGSPLWLSPLMREASYDPIRDFSPISLVTNSPNVLVIHPSLPVTSVRGLVALARSRPGELNYASGSSGASSHLAAELFKSMAKVDIVRIPYKGLGPALTALISGQMQLMFANAGAVTPHVASGRLRPLAVTSAQPSSLAPGLPTLASAGLSGYESTSIAGLLGPAKLPASVMARLHQEVVRVLARPEVRDKLFQAGVETVGNTPEEFSATIKSEMARVGKLVREAGIREQ